MVNYKDAKEADNDEWKDAIKLCKEILAELADLPESAEDFSSSVEDKVLSIMEWIEENKHVTDKQTQALKNMRAGARRWRR